MAPNQENIEARLCAYVDDELTAQERIEIEEHLAANPHHRRLLQELAQTRTLLRSLPRAKSPSDLVEGFQSQLERSSLLDDDTPDVAGVILRINRRPQVFAAAAMVLLAVGLAVVIYRTLPTTKPPREVAIGTPGAPSTPGLATSDDSGTSVGKPSGTPSVASRGGDGPEGIAGDARKDSTTTPRPTGGGAGGGHGGTMGETEVTSGGGMRGKGGGFAKESSGTPVAGPDDVLTLKNKMAKADEVRAGGIDGSTTVGGNLSVANGNSGRNTSSQARLDEDMPVVVVVNAADTTLANGDVSSYLRQNKIAYISDTDTAAAPTPSTLNASAALAPAAAPNAVAGVEEPTRREDVAKKAEVAGEDKKVGWYMGSDGKMYYRAAAEPADASATTKAKSPAAPGVTTGGPGVGNAGSVASASTSTTQPLRGVELANSYNRNGNFDNNGGNPVTYRAVMSHRQVLDLNTRLSQRGGQSAEVRSDAIVNRPEGYALADNMRLNRDYTGNTANGSNVTSNAISPSVLDKPASAAPQPVTRAAKGVEAGAGRVDNIGDAEQSRKSAPTNDSKTAPSAPAAVDQQKDSDPRGQRSRAIQGNGAYGADRKAGEKASQDLTPLAAQNATPSPAGPAQPVPTDPQQTERQTAPPMQPQSPSQQRATVNEALPSQVQTQQKSLADPAAAIDRTSQQLIPPTAATASSSQEAAVQSASVSAMKQLAVDPDEQPREVFIVVTGQASIIPAPAVATPSTQPATALPATRPTEPTPRDSK